MTSTAHVLKHEQLCNEVEFLRRLSNESESLLNCITVAQASCRLALKARRELVSANTDHEKVRGDNQEKMVTIRGLPGTLGWGHLRAHLKDKHGIEVNRVDKGPGWTLAILTLNMARDVALRALLGAKIEGKEIQATAGEPSAEEMEEQKSLQAVAVTLMDTTSFHKKHPRDQKPDKGNKKRRH
jgi:hypothetical protein